jgi:uncharacterized protein with von Willebrand factor type A (vWA) domain
MFHTGQISHGGRGCETPGYAGPTPPRLPEDGKLAENIAHFARALRKAGLPVGPGRTLDAVRAVAAAGFARKEDFYYTLQAVFVSRPEERIVFAQVFRLFWRDPRYMEQMMSLMLPQIRGVQGKGRPGRRKARRRGAVWTASCRPRPKPPKRRPTRSRSMPVPPCRPRNG